MSLYKRKDSSVWWVKFRHNGQTIQRSTGTDDKLKAQEYHDRLKAELWEQARLGVKPRYLWNEAVVRWLQETEHKASQVSDKFHLRWLDAYRGKPVAMPNNSAWEKALKRAGIENFRWHDLRHTWASWHVQAGTPLHVLQELGGWESVEMVRRYAHLSSEHLADYVDRLSGLRLVEGGSGYVLATLPEMKRG